MVKAVRNATRPGVGRLRDLRRRRRAVGSQGAAARPAAAPPARRRARQVPVYGSGGFTTYTDDQLARPADGWVDEQSIPRVKIKIGESWGTNRTVTWTGCARHARSSATTSSCSSTPTAATSASRRSGSCAPRATSTSAGSRSRSPPTISTACGRSATPSLADVAAGEYGHDLVLLPPDVRGRRGRLPAGRRVPVRRHHRMAARRRRRRRARPADLRPLRTAPARPRRRRHAEPAPPGMVPRPCPDRDHCSSTAPSTPPAAPSAPTTAPPVTASRCGRPTPSPTESSRTSREPQS